MQPLAGHLKTCLEGIPSSPVLGHYLGKRPGGEAQHGDPRGWDMAAGPTLWTSHCTSLPDCFPFLTDVPPNSYLLGKFKQPTDQTAVSYRQSLTHP